ncbi:hypothetical protein pEaSNUABM9_00058 [Erwinia phage pEa_SNUABM_9]|nr:hypothetical protein pEaSNUABM9_00058 [Erwinia phage pEa_SNUABM_9]
MIYNVLAIHSWGIKLGVVGYLTDGEVFLEAVEKTVAKFPKMRVDLPVGELESDVIYSALRTAAMVYLDNHQTALPRVQLSRLKTFLDSLSDEYRRWKFDAGMECTANDSVMEELTPLIQLHRSVSSDNFSVANTILEYSIEAVSQFFAKQIVEEFAHVVAAYRLMHKGNIERLVITLDFPQCKFNIMDMRLHIHVAEE